MRNPDAWVPTKYVRGRHGLEATRDRSKLSPASLIPATLVARFYERAIPRHTHGRLLDLGCGTFPLYDVYRAYASEIVGLDWPSSLHVPANVDLYANLGHGLPLADDSIDTIIFS